MKDKDGRHHYRHPFFTYSAFEGVELHETEAEIQFIGVATRAHEIKVTGKINFTKHPVIEVYKFLHKIAGDQPEYAFLQGGILKRYT